MVPSSPSAFLVHLDGMLVNRIRPVASRLGYVHQRRERTRARGPRYIMEIDGEPRRVVVEKAEIDGNQYVHFAGDRDDGVLI